MQASLPSNVTSKLAASGHLRMWPVFGPGRRWVGLHLGTLARSIPKVRHHEGLFEKGS